MQRSLRPSRKRGFLCALLVFVVLLQAFGMLILLSSSQLFDGVEVLSEVERKLSQSNSSVAAKIYSIMRTVFHSEVNEGDCDGVYDAEVDEAIMRKEVQRKNAKNPSTFVCGFVTQLSSLDHVDSAVALGGSIREAASTCFRVALRPAPRRICTMIALHTIDNLDKVEVSGGKENRMIEVSVARRLRAAGWMHLIKTSTLSFYQLYALNVDVFMFIKPTTIVVSPSILNLFETHDIRSEMTQGEGDTKVLRIMAIKTLVETDAKVSSFQSELVLFVGVPSAAIVAEEPPIEVTPVHNKHSNRFVISSGEAMTKLAKKTPSSKFLENMNGELRPMLWFFDESKTPFSLLPRLSASKQFNEERIKDVAERFHLKVDKEGKRVNFDRLQLLQLMHNDWWMSFLGVALRKHHCVNSPFSLSGDDRDVLTVNVGSPRQYTFNSSWENKGRSSSDLVIVEAHEGKSCNHACNAKGYKCSSDPVHLAEVNNCKTISRYFDGKCQVCQFAVGDVGAAAPFLYEGSKTCFLHSHFFQLLRLLSPLSDKDAPSQDELILPQKCSAAVKQAQRLCACIESSVTRKDTQRQTLAAQERDDASCPCKERSDLMNQEEQLTCYTYLSNFSNVERVVPLSSAAAFGRTVKLKAFYRDACVTAVIKLPQSLFPLEPYSEFVAYQLAEGLEMSYIPPTTWIFVPLCEVERAVAGFDGFTEGDKGSTYKYSKWVSRESLLYAMNHDLVTTFPDTGELVIGCSVQLWVGQLKPTRHTNFRFSEGTYDALNLELSRVNGVEDADKWAASKVGGKVVAGEIGEFIGFLSDQVILDYLLANDDRGPEKNDYVQIVSKPQDRQKATHHFLLLDQGKSLYTASCPEDSKCTKRLKNLCLAKERTRRGLKYINKQGLVSFLGEKVPEPILRYIGKQRLSWLSHRVDYVLSHLNNCSSAFGSNSIIP